MILVTSINPTPAGEGKTTITVGFQAMNLIGKNRHCPQRAFFGPTMGIKGGATAEDTPSVTHGRHKLAFTGDLHAITAATTCLQQSLTIISIKVMNLTSMSIV